MKIVGFVNAAVGAFADVLENLEALVDGVLVVAVRLVRWMMVVGELLAFVIEVVTSMIDQRLLNLVGHKVRMRLISLREHLTIVHSTLKMVKVIRNLRI